MNEKLALVLDTNFLFSEGNQLDKTLKQLTGLCDIYITQISIEERKEQRCREFMDRYDKFNVFCKEYRSLFALENTIDCEEAKEKLRSKLQAKYELSFPERIIPFNSNKRMLDRLLDRANRKIAPFCSDDRASDKGFKDSLIWLSILEYFKTNGPDNIILVTDDNGFKRDSLLLCQEFNQFTGKSIEIKENSFYKTLVTPKNVNEKSKTQEKVTLDINSFRERIHSVIENICGYEAEDYWGNPEWNRTFTICQRVDASYMEYVFTKLRQDIEYNLFEKNIIATKIFCLDDRVTEDHPIPMASLEEALSLYEEIKEKWPEYLPQFYNAAASVVNSVYQEPLSDIDDDHLPF